MISTVWNKITKRECLTEKFIEGIKFNEDELFNLDNLHNIKKIVFIDEVLHNYYCAPYNSNSQASAVNSIYSQENFWEHKSTIWHMGMKNHMYRLKSIEKYFPLKQEELQYIRSFDFFFWDFFLMAKNKVNEENIYKACISIFETNLFKETLKSKKSYGLKLLPNYKNNLKEFVKIAYYAFNDIKEHNKTMSMIRVFAGLFAYFFYQTECLNLVDFLAKSAYELENMTTAEAYYVKFLLKVFKNKS